MPKPTHPQCEIPPAEELERRNSYKELYTFMEYIIIFFQFQTLILTKRSHTFAGSTLHLRLWLKKIFLLYKRALLRIPYHSVCASATGAMTLFPSHPRIKLELQQPHERICSPYICRLLSTSFCTSFFLFNRDPRRKYATMSKGPSEADMLQRTVLQNGPLCLLTLRKHL